MWTVCGVVQLNDQLFPPDQGEQGKLRFSVVPKHVVSAWMYVDAVRISVWTGKKGLSTGKGSRTGCNGISVKFVLCGSDDTRVVLILNSVDVPRWLG